MNSGERKFLKILTRRKEYLTQLIESGETGVTYDYNERNALAWAIRKLEAMEHKEEYFAFLDELRESGETNMFGAAAYLRERWPSMTTQDSRAILVEWMDTFADRHPDGR